MKILLLGKSGLLGHALFEAAEMEHEVLAPEHEECDITNKSHIEAKIKQFSPDIVINATGYTHVDDAEDHEREAFQINEQGVKNLCEALGSRGIILIHFSTDYVFEGRKKEGYGETDSPSPLSVYGASKAAGEKHMQQLKKYFLVRTSWLFGPHGRNFVDTMLQKAEHGAALKVVSDQFGCPTYTLDLAQAVLRLLKGFPYGIYHIVNNGSCSWHQFAEEIFKQLGVPQKISPIGSQEFNRKAKRPMYSILQNTRFPHLRNWQEALESFLHDKTLILS